MWGECLVASRRKLAGASTWRDRDHALDLPATRFLQWRVEFPVGGSADGSTWRVDAVSVSAWQNIGADWPVPR